MKQSEYIQRHSERYDEYRDARNDALVAIRSASKWESVRIRLASFVLGEKLFILHKNFIRNQGRMEGHGFTPIFKKEDID